MMELISAIISIKSKVSLDSVIFPVSILDISRISLSSDKRYLDEVSILSKQSFTRTGSSIFNLPMVLIPIIAFIGVLISWLILERKSDLALLAAFAAARASLKSCSCFAVSALCASRSLIILMAIISPLMEFSTKIRCEEIQ